MIGHFVGVAIEFPVKYVCDSVTQTSTNHYSYEQDNTTLETLGQCHPSDQWYNQFVKISCTATSKAAHEIVEFAVDQTLIALGVKITLDFFGMHHECNHGWGPTIIGSLGGIAAENIFDQANIFANAAIGFGANLAISWIAEEIFHGYLHGEHHGHGHGHAH